MGRPWTETEETDLVEMLRDGSTPRECGEVLGRTKLACEQRASRVKNRRDVKLRRKVGRPVDHDREERIIVLFTDPVSILEAARRLGKGYTTVRRTVNRLVRMGVLKPNHARKKGRRYRIAGWWVRKLRDDRGVKPLTDLAACVDRGRMFALKG